ncbi:PQQ-binding-like beta-propeller repeat protein [Streptomyces sp. NPDC102451]|uniref:caspase, EACC1-associated type n=1 Tax=Streptomyces sp. NPDC102451 TaxID=3366177 RepID=UPI003827365C
MTIPDPAASRAVLIGVDTYTHPDLAALPAAGAAARRLAALFLDTEVWGLPAHHVTVLGADASSSAILGAVRDAARNVTDTLVVYFSGHGLRDRDERLYLALADADADHPQIGTLPYRNLRDVVRRAGHRARYRLTLLDCCYSGLAGSMAGADAPTRADLAQALDEQRTTGNDEADDYGDVVLTSAPPTRRSFVLPGATYPEFTGELIDVIHHGIPGAGPSISVDNAWRKVRARLRERGSPEPQQFAQNAVARRLRLRNRAAGPRDGMRSWRVALTSPVTSMTAADGLMYLSTQQRVYALDAATGAPRWAHEAASGDSLTVVDEVLYLATRSGVRALDAATGAPRWAYESGRASYRVRVADGTVYGSEGERAYALDAATGTPRWEQDAGRGEVAGVAEGLVHLVRPGSLCALDAATGAQRWKHETGPYFGLVTVAEGMVYDRSTDGDVLALEAATGTPRWTHRTGWGWGRVRAADGMVYLSTVRDTRALDAATGALVWAYENDGKPSPLTVSDGMVLTGRDGVQALDAGTGTRLWTYGSDWDFEGATVTGGVVYGLSREQAWALDAESGTMLWTYGRQRWSMDTPDTYSEYVVRVAGGMLYLRSEEHVYALDAATGAGPKHTRYDVQLPEV